MHLLAEPSAGDAVGMDSGGNGDPAQLREPSPSEGANAFVNVGHGSREQMEPGPSGHTDPGGSVFRRTVTLAHRLPRQMLGAAKGGDRYF